MSTITTSGTEVPVRPQRSGLRLNAGSLVYAAPFAMFVLLAVTTDGVHIEVAANIASAADAAGALRHGADSVGLLRTEFLFLDRREPPDEDEQAADSAPDRDAAPRSASATAGRRRAGVAQGR